MFEFVECSVCSGDVRRENRFARNPPRPSPRPIRRPGDRPSRPAIINPDDLKDLDDLDNDCEDGWAGKQPIISCTRSEVLPLDRIYKAITTVM